MKKTRRILVLGDLHCPWHHRKALGWVYSLIKQLRPNVIIQVGDGVDYFSLSRFPKAANDIKMTPREEIEEAHDCLKDIWQTIRRLARGAQCYQLLGNHCDRLNLRIIDKIPELKGLIKLEHLFEFPGVNTIHDSRKELVIDDIVFQHGHYLVKGKHLAHNQMNTVYGHTHRAHILYVPRRNRLLWEFNVGFLADPKAKVLHYSKQTWSNWAVGVGWIDQHGPRFIPYEEKP